jgi:hypothetical protein
MLIAASFLLWTAVVQAPGQPPAPAARETPSDVFALVEAFAVVKPLTPEGVGRVLGLALRKAKNQPNEYFVLYEAHGTGLVRSVDLRIPASRSAKPNGFLALELVPDPPVGRRAVVERMGTNGELYLPPPHYPAHVPFSLGYRRDGSKISFQFERTDDHLVGLALDRIDPR